MSKIIISILLILQFSVFSQSYAPPAEQTGSTAIHKESQLFVGWASGISVQRGFVNIEDTTIEANGSNRTTYGEPSFALGAATGNASDAVSLGDSGVAILTFDQPIINGPSYDFAVFENSFSDDYLELAHVEVSSDGINYVRFPSHSEVQYDVQIHGFGSTDARRIYNLAGKYKAGYGTPFDLEEIKDSPNLDVNNILYVKIIDVIGSVGAKGTYDSYGNKINEPFSTPYETGGFDLEAVGAINQVLNLEEVYSEKIQFTVYPNPSSGIIKIQTSENRPYDVQILNNLGQLIYERKFTHTQLIIDIPNLDSGVYHVYLKTDQGRKHRIITVN